MAGKEGTVAAVSAPGALTPELATAFTDLQRHGWHVLTGLRQPGRAACIDAVLVGPGGVIVLESAGARRRPSVLSTVSTAVVALVPADVRRHVQSVVCPPAERGDGSAVSVKPAVLPGFVRSLPQVLSAETVSNVALSLQDALSGPTALQLWTVNKVLEWTKDARGREVTPNRATRRRNARQSGLRRMAGWVTRHAALLVLGAVAFALLIMLGH